jgi:hypothetical protein
MTKDDAVQDQQEERLGSPEVVGVSFTVGELILRLSQLSQALPIFSGRSNKAGIAIHQHDLIDSSKDYVSFNHFD